MPWRVDPDVNLYETLALAEQVLANARGDVQHLDAARLATLVLALDNQIHHGGPLPQRWQQRDKPHQRHDTPEENDP